MVGGVPRAAIKGQKSNEVKYACDVYIMVNRSLQNMYGQFYRSMKSRNVWSQ